MAGIFVYIIAQSVHYIEIVATEGRPGLIFLTLLLSIVFDQIKSVLFLYLVYTIVIRRFMLLAVNEHEYVKAEILEIPKQENALPRLQVFCLKTLESTTFEMMSMALISIYTVFVLFQLTLAEFFGVPDGLLAQIDNVFLTLFFIEIILKTFASNLMFLLDLFNAFDAFVVIISEVLNLMGIVAKGLGVLRLLRVVVITIRKITGKQSNLRHKAMLENPLDSVIKILQSITEAKDLSNSIKKEAKWAIDIIESNKLYDLSFDIAASEEKSTGVEAKAWLNMTTDAANDTTKWFERDLDDFLKEIHRDEEEPDQNKVDEEEERVMAIIELPQKQWKNLDKIIDDFNKWDFEIFKYFELLGETTILHFGFKLFLNYGLIEKFSISETNFKNLLKSIKSSFYENNQFHNVVKAVEVTRNYHYFIKKGDLMKHLSDLNIMACFLSCLMGDLGHPGVNNQYLIATRHPKAIRYNDRSVLENHHCAMAFKLLLDP